MNDLENHMVLPHADDEVETMTECRYCGDDSYDGVCDDCRIENRMREIQREDLKELARALDPRSWWK